ncbi:MAG: hypothetical protein BGO77_08210 [Caedibacter sp. 37-49]|mgnify:CR=1 FL=1|nr:MAG: hypothetical protein BGO77_08210 [Caedibacter sp. 37-49]
MMQKPLLYSLVLHLLLFILFIFGLPSWRKSNPDLLLPIPIDVVEIGAKTQAPKPAIQPKKEEPKKEEPKKEPPKKEEPKPQPKPENKPAPEPEKPKPEPEPKAEPVAPAPKEKPKPPTPPKKLEKKPDKKKANAFDSVLKNLEEIEKTVPDAVNEDKTNDNGPEQQVGEIGDTITASERDALIAYFKNCWSAPAGTKGAHEISRIPIKIYFNIDRTVLDAKPVETANMSNPTYRIIAESAIRSVKGPKCSPVPAKLLPIEKYGDWKVSTINFLPEDLM